MKKFNRDEARKKAKALVSQMTVMEKASQLKYDAAVISRLGIPAYNWWNEALHGVARAGTATVFPQAIGLAAMFDDEMVNRIADVIATEGRAKYNAYSAEGDRDIYKGLTFWSPNVNIFRDPRWGRGHETYGEDPYLTARLGVAFVKGLQGDGPVMKAAACAKHFAVHSGPEDLRHEFDAKASKKDMEETYLPAFEALVKEAGVEAVMGAYNRTNGEPCCGSKTLIQEILRDKWGFEGHFVSDCWAIRDFHEHHNVTRNARESAAMALKAGCDLNCGNTYLHIMAAYQDGLVTEEEITKAAERLMTTRYLLGLFEGSEFDEIPYRVVECKEHRDISEEAAIRGAVLLKNNGLLPLSDKMIKSIAVIGPNANSRAALYANYYGTSSHYTTILEGIQNYLPVDVPVYYSEGCHLYKDRVEGLAWRQDRISEAVIAAKHSDVVVLCVGLDESLEGEELDTGNHVGSGDKKDLSLPEVQSELIEKVLAVGKPTIVVTASGSALDLSYADAHADAVLQVWYPGAGGGNAAAKLIFGEASPSGKLPVTFYRNLDDLPDFTDYSMTNRTYRYLQQPPLYPFGYGLTYGTVNVDAAQIVGKVDIHSDIEIKVKVKNSSQRSLSEVIQIYIKDEESKMAVRNPCLCGFQRVNLSPGADAEVIIKVDNKAMTVVDEQGNRTIESRKYTLYAGTSQPDQRSIELTGAAPIEMKLELMEEV
ncbi:MAG: glycoside hydrolase family 3 C-terminal domain-containing protein [Lachnospiraceae bacterium]